MEKSYDMDFDDWELLPDARHALSEDFGLESESNFLFCDDIDVNYFSNEKNSSSTVIGEKDEGDAVLEWKDIGVVTRATDDRRDAAPPVSFRKLNDCESVDMKVESPGTSSSSTKSLIMASIEPEKILFDCQDEKESESEIEPLEPEIEENHDVYMKHKIWRWGAFAAATLCIFLFGGRRAQKHKHEHQKIQFQIYNGEKRIKQVLEQASRLKLNQAFFTARGVPMSRANASFSGYYDGI